MIEIPNIYPWIFINLVVGSFLAKYRFPCTIHTYIICNQYLALLHQAGVLTENNVFFLQFFPCIFFLAKAIVQIVPESLFIDEYFKV